MAALNGEFNDWAIDEEECLLYKGQWRKKVFKANKKATLDLELGTGTGTHFAHYAQNNPDHCVIGIERKYKPLIQTIRRAVNAGCTNARGVRYHADFISDIFAKEELDNVFIHFPDPWVKKRKAKNRLIQPEFLEELYEMQKSGAFLEFKTDDKNYYKEALARFKKSKYKMIDYTEDLHNSPWAVGNVITQFERIFLNQDIKINYVLMMKE